jgi:predicted PurR-regulated permease PerM
MTAPSPSELTINRCSFLIIAAFLWTVGSYGLATPFITVLFSCLVLHFLGRHFSTKVAIILFTALNFLLFFLFVRFLSEAVNALPQAAARSVPIVLDWANKWVEWLRTSFGLDLPFTTLENVKAFARDGVKEQLSEVARFAEIFTKESVYVIIGLVAACALFATPYLDLGRDSYPIRNNVYSVFAQKLGTRFSRFFESFRTVMGAQIIISAVNTFFTGLFVLALIACDTPLPHSFVIVVVTFLCGILPIVGNLISNTIIVSIGLTQSAKLAIISLLYLVILHKFEYFLNSKIIGGKIKNPMWVTLLGLLVGERVMGIPGMILAPVVINYLKVEGTKVPVGGVEGDSKNT